MNFHSKRLIMEEFFSIFNLINRNVVLNSNIIGKTKVGYDKKKDCINVQIESLDRTSKTVISIPSADLLITDADIKVNRFALEDFKNQFDEFLNNIKL